MESNSSEAQLMSMQSSPHDSTLSFGEDRQVHSRTPEDWRKKVKKGVKKNLLLILTLIAIVIGAVLGFTVRLLQPSKDALMWLGMPGDVFLRMLKMMILPLIVSNVITGTASLSLKTNGKMSMIALVYIVLTNIIGCVLAVVLTLLIQPGNSPNQDGGSSGLEQTLQTQDIFADLIRNIFPDNIIRACSKQVQTYYGETLKIAQVNTTEGLVNKTVKEVKKSVGYSDGSNILGIIVCSMIFGIATSANKEKGRPFLKFFSSTSEIVITILRWFLWYSPIGIVSLMAASLAAITEIEETLARIGLFVVTVTAGLAIHQLVVLPLLYFVIVRNNPFRFFFSNIPAWVTAFASTSGAMAIPDVIKACEEKHKIDSRLTRFAVPFVTTLNADGSALYIVSASMFLSQLEGFTLDAGQIVMLVTLTTVACMALPSVPSSSIVTIVILLTSLNLPVQEIALLFTVEWLLDRLRTTSNVMSHAMSVPIIYRFCKEDLKNHPEQTQERKVRFDLDDYSEGYGSDDKRLNEEEMVEFATHNL